MERQPSIFTSDAQERLKDIHSLSQHCNGGKGKEHEQKLLRLAEKHVDEVRALLEAGDPHGITEAGDLAVLCLELILEAGREPDVVMDECLTRYDRTLNRLIDEAKRG
ncbi:MAG: hypothetical protein GF333_01130 [Candidatus Omnitrophica bacterium]|nr:hypothetical protein [Candidatus Omnitrophota bacterium]